MLFVTYRCYPIGNVMERDRPKYFFFFINKRSSKCAAIRRENIYGNFPFSIPYLST